MRLNASEILSRLNSSYWFVPLLVTLAGVALALVLLLLDSRVSLDTDSPFATLGPSSAEGARALLSAVIGAMITVISVTFSVTIVALTVAAQHFGPRVLNNFVRQTSAQVVLGTFRQAISHAQRPPEGATTDSPSGSPDAPADAAVVQAIETGYVQRIDYGAIVQLAGARGAVVWIRREPGAFVVAGTVALIHPPIACDEVFASTLRRACIVGRDRTLWHDPEFAVTQLVEIALRNPSAWLMSQMSPTPPMPRRTADATGSTRYQAPAAACPWPAGPVTKPTPVPPFDALFCGESVADEGHCRRTRAR